MGSQLDPVLFQLVLEILGAGCGGVPGSFVCGREVSQFGPPCLFPLLDTIRQTTRSWNSSSGFLLYSDGSPGETVGNIAGKR